jgi:hypothetical protein
LAVRERNLQFLVSSPKRRPTVSAKPAKPLHSKDKVTAMNVPYGKRESEALERSFAASDPPLMSAERG